MKIDDVLALIDAAKWEGTSDDDAFDLDSDALVGANLQIEAIREAVVKLNQEQRQNTESKQCIWAQQSIDIYGDGTYETQCGHMFSFVDGDREENDARFCQYCGGEIVEIKEG